MQQQEIIVVGYCGHAYVAIDIIQSSGYSIRGYCDNEVKVANPFSLDYLGKELELQASVFSDTLFFIGVGDNGIRARIIDNLRRKGARFINAVHPRAVVASGTRMGEALMIAAGCSINPLVTLGDGVICNTNCGIDHECTVGEYSHIGPGAVLCGNVTVGTHCFIGANAVIKQGVKVGDNTTIGAGAVVLRDIPPGSVIYGNPGKLVQSKTIE